MERGEDWTKVPFNPHNGHRAKTDDHRTWGSFETALRRYEAREDIAGVGFVFTEGDPYCGIDYDDCLDESGGPHPRVAEDLKALGGYAEVSPSGTGIKVIVRARKPGDRCRAKNVPWGGEIEVYDRDRFFALTGEVLDGHDVVTNAQEAVEEIYGRSFPASQGHPPPRASGSGLLKDEELLRKARNSRTGAGFRRLHDHGDTSGHRSHSEADFALLGRLCFWTRLDPEQMERIFVGSALYRESKGRDYVRRSVASSLLRFQGEVYDPEEARGRARERVTAGMWAPLFTEEWMGTTGGTDHDLFCGLLIEATESGIPRRDGSVNVTPGTRGLAKRCGTTQKTAMAGLKRLEERGLVEILPKTRARAREVIVLKLTRNYSTKIHTRAGSLSAVKLCEFGELLRLRWGQARSALTSRVGKVAGLLLSWMVAFPEGLTADIVSECVGRRKDSVVRYLRRLEGAGLVVRSGCLWRLAPAFDVRLDEELGSSGSKTSERLQERKTETSEQASEYWGSRPEVEVPEPDPDSSNSVEDLLEVPKNLLPTVEVDGDISELEKVGPPDPDDRIHSESEVFDLVRNFFSERRAV